MPYTVMLPEVANQDDFAEYIRRMLEVGIDRANAPRVFEPAMGRYLPVWDEGEQAERFAKVLRTPRIGKKWRVREVAAEEVDRGPLGPIEINVGCQSDGFVYELDYFNRKLVEAAAPKGRRVVPALMLCTNQKEDFDANQWEFIDQVALLLTGLSPEELRPFGGVRVYDPAHERYLGPSQLHNVRA